MSDYRNHPYYMKMTVDSLFQNGWQILKKNYGWLFFYSFIVMALLQLLTAPLLRAYFEDLTNLIENPESIGPMMGRITSLILATLLGYTLLSAFLTNFILNYDPGRPHLSLLGESITRFFIPLMVAGTLAGIIAAIGTVLGVFILIIGAVVAIIYFSTVFFPLSAIVVNERANPFDSLGRCFRLVHSDFWNTIGWVVLIMVIYLVLSLILGALTMIPSAGSFFDIMSNPEDVIKSAEGLMSAVNNPLMLLLNSITSAILFPVFPVFGMLIYLHLKHGEDEKADHTNLMEHLSK